MNVINIINLTKIYVLIPKINGLLLLNSLYLLTDEKHVIFF